MEEALKRFFGWIFKNPLSVLVIVLVAAALINGPALEAFIIGLLNRLLNHVLLPLVPLALVVWAILSILGYGRLWGKKKSGK